MAKQANSNEHKQAWQSCYYCPLQSFKSQIEFVRFVFTLNAVYLIFSNEKLTYGSGIRLN